MQTEKANLIKQIADLKKERNALIMAHNYQPADIQDIADIAGDSLELARAASDVCEEVIVFCGVYFMAETANIICPNKTTLLPVVEAGCKLADTITAEELRGFKDKNPGVPVVCYVNSGADIKAESDYCCTSGNALKVARSIDSEDLIFVPDRNLADYVKKNTDKNIIAWNGACPIHDDITIEAANELKSKFPGAPFLAHPECRPEVLDVADVIASTSGIIAFVKDSSEKHILIATEEGIRYRLERDNPSTACHFPEPLPVCEDMKRIGLRDIVNSLKELKPRVSVSEETAGRALKSIERMLRIK